MSFIPIYTKFNGVNFARILGFPRHFPWYKNIKFNEKLKFILLLINAHTFSIP